MLVNSKRKQTLFVCPFFVWLEMKKKGSFFGSKNQQLLSLFVSSCLLLKQKKSNEQPLIVLQKLWFDLIQLSEKKNGASVNFERIFFLIKLVRVRSSFVDRRLRYLGLCWVMRSFYGPSHSITFVGFSSQIFRRKNTKYRCDSADQDSDPTAKEVGPRFWPKEMTL